MILQAYDFVELNKRYGCMLQMGGSDQWGNIVNGIDLGRRMLNAHLFALTTPLITTSSGAKMGKTAAGAVWLDADMLSAYDFWQFWRNTEDGDVARFLKLFTVLPLDEIGRLAALKGQEINEAKKVLATEVTALIHGRAAAEEAAETARRTFEEGALAETLPTIEMPRGELDGGPGRARRLRQSRPGHLERRSAPSDQGRRHPGQRRRRHRRKDDAHAVAADAGRRDQALARKQAPRAAEAGVTFRAHDPELRTTGRRFGISASCGARADRRARAAREFEELADQARRHHRDRIDAQHRRARRADHLIGQADEAFVAAAAEEHAEHRNLPEHVVEAEERHEGAAHAHLFAQVVDVAFRRRADHRAAHRRLRGWRSGRGCG